MRWDDKRREEGMDWDGEQVRRKQGEGNEMGNAATENSSCRL